MEQELRGEDLAQFVSDRRTVTIRYPRLIGFVKKQGSISKCRNAPVSHILRGKVA